MGRVAGLARERRRGRFRRMSRAFTREDREEVPPDYRLPEPGTDYYDEACAWALLTGADEGDSRSAEIATGCRWGEPRLVPHIRAILADVEVKDQARVAQLCRRFLRAVGSARR